jgi:hypothetical protein
MTQKVESNMKHSLFPALLVLISLASQVQAQTTPAPQSPQDETKNSFGVSYDSTHGNQVQFWGNGQQTVAGEVVGYLKKAAETDPSIATTQSGPAAGFPQVAYPFINYKYGNITGFFTADPMSQSGQSVTFKTSTSSVVFSNLQDGKQNLEVRLDAAVCENLFDLMKAAGLAPIVRAGATFYNGQNMFSFMFAGDDGKPVYSCDIKFDPSN